MLLLKLQFNSETFQTTEGDPGTAECAAGPQEAEGRGLQPVFQVRPGGRPDGGARHRGQREDGDRQTERLPGENCPLTEEPAESG